MSDSSERKRALRGHKSDIPEIKVSGIMPDPPDSLDEIALEEWNRSAPLLHKMKCLSQEDLPTFSAYCSTFSRWWQLEKRVSQIEEMLDERYDNTTVNVLMRVHGAAASASKDLVRFASHFGMSPKSRTEIAAIKHQSKESKFKGLLGGLRAGE